MLGASKPIALAFSTPGILRFSTFGTPENSPYPCDIDANALTIGTPGFLTIGTFSTPGIW